MKIWQTRAHYPAEYTEHFPILWLAFKHSMGRTLPVEWAFPPPTSTIVLCLWEQFGPCHLGWTGWGKAKMLHCSPCANGSSYHSCKTSPVQVEDVSIWGVGDGLEFFLCCIFACQLTWINHWAYFCFLSWCGIFHKDLKCEHALSGSVLLKSARLLCTVFSCHNLGGQFKNK